jgi:hypothetical protein
MSITLDRPAHSRARRMEGASGKDTTVWDGCVGIQQPFGDPDEI